MKLIFDTDIGSDIDDALALLLLLHTPGIELLGVSTVYGHTELRAKVARRLLDAARSTAAVVVGEAEPLRSCMPIWHTGLEGQGILSDRETATPVAEFGITSGAPEFIVQQVSSQPGEVIILALGALTNLAKALQLDPCLSEKIGHVFFMGAGVTFREPVPTVLCPGSQYRAEPSHNVRCDVEAARIVFESGLQITFLTNDVTTLVWWDGIPVRQLLDARRPPETVAVGRLLDVWLKYRSGLLRRPICGTCPHDALTVAECTQPGFVRYVSGVMHVHEDASTTFVPNEGGWHRAGIVVDTSAFLKWLSPRLMAKPR